MITEWPS